MAELASAAMQNTMQQYIKLITTLPDAMRAVASVAIPKFGGSETTRFGLPTNWTFGPEDAAQRVDHQPALVRRPLGVAGRGQAGGQGRRTSRSTMSCWPPAPARSSAISPTATARPIARLTAGVPVSLREAGNTDFNNQVTMVLVSLATDIDDPLERLKTINASSRSAKELTGSFKAAIPTDFPSFGAPWIMTGLATLFGRSRISDQIPPIANTVISNVPGAQVPMYMAGAKLATYYPVSIPSHGVALNITVQSYNGSLDYGLTACRRAVPDVDEIANYLVEAHAELKRLVLGADAAAVAPRAVAAEPAPAPSDAPPAPAKKRAPAKAKAAKPPKAAPEHTTAEPVVVKSKARSASPTSRRKPKAQAAAAEPATPPAALEPMRAAAAVAPSPRRRQARPQIRAQVRSK